MKDVNEYKKYISPLSERYAGKDMQYLFSQEHKFRTWRRLWVALAESERELGLNISEEQIEEAYQKMAEQYEMELEKVKEYVPSEEIVRDQKFQKAMEVIVDSAVEKAPEAPAAE